MGSIIIKYTKTATYSTLLPVNTKVAVNNILGIVVDSKYVKNQFGMPICLHKIHCTHRIINHRTGAKKLIDITNKCITITI